MDRSALGLQLLADVETLFKKAASGVDRLRSSEIVGGLLRMEGRPWHALGRHKRPLTPISLAWLLSGYEIYPETLRFPGQIRKGYRISSFRDAWNRYLGNKGVTKLGP